MFKKSKFKQSKTGDRVCTKHIPNEGEPKKFQPLFNGPFRAVNKISSVVLRLRHVRGGKIKSVHTNNVQVFHEDFLELHDCPHVRRAYPAPDQVQKDDSLPIVYPRVESVPLSFPSPSEPTLSSSPIPGTPVPLATAPCLFSSSRAICVPSLTFKYGASFLP